MYTSVIVSYMNSILILLVLSGLFVLKIDLNRYRRRKMEKELRTSKWLGWINIILGGGGLIASWLFI